MTQIRVIIILQNWFSQRVLYLNGNLCTLLIDIKLGHQVISLVWKKSRIKLGHKVTLHVLKKSPIKSQQSCKVTFRHSKI